MNKKQLEERFEMILPDRVIIAKNPPYGVVYYIDKQYLYNAGYRKESETAKEILQPIYELCKVRNNIQWDDVYFLVHRYGVEIEE